MKLGQKNEQNEKEGRAPNFLFGWTANHIRAFQLTAERVLVGKDKGNASELARTVLEQFMFSIWGAEESVKMGILEQKWKRAIPPPEILEFAIEEYHKHQGRLIDRPVSDATVDSELQSEREVVNKSKNNKRHLTKAS